MHTPLAERLRPSQYSELFGQEHLIQEGGYLHTLIQSGRAHSLLLYGPPGCGKTTLARLYASAFRLPFRQQSAVFQSAQELKQLLRETSAAPLLLKSTILFVDEIHRFNRAQQDLFLPFLEDGSLILIGATTENPSFSLNSALLSRFRVLTLKTLDNNALRRILDRCEALGNPLPLDAAGRELLIDYAAGDGRHLLNLVENLLMAAQPSWDVESLAHFLQKRPPLYDKSRDGHYNLMSALHKSIRGSDPDAALYWLARMLTAGEDPLFIARRLIRVASEDVGLADPQALSLCLAARETYETLGSPEGELALAQAAIYLALAPKSNAAYLAWEEAKEAAGRSGHLNPPPWILNAPTPFMKSLGYGEGYRYDHDTPDGCSGQAYFPTELSPSAFYRPVERGFERDMRKRLEYFKRFRLG